MVTDIFSNLGPPKNAAAILSQNAAKLYYKMRQFFLLQNKQNESILLQNATFITKCIGKMRHGELNLATGKNACTYVFKEGVFISARLKSLGVSTFDLSSLQEIDIS